MYRHNFDFLSVFIRLIAFIWLLLYISIEAVAEIIEVDAIWGSTICISTIWHECIKRPNKKPQIIDTLKELKTSHSDYISDGLQAKKFLNKSIWTLNQKTGKTLLFPIDFKQHSHAKETKKKLH